MHKNRLAKKTPVRQLFHNCVTHFKHSYLVRVRVRLCCLLSQYPREHVSHLVQQGQPTSPVSIFDLHLVDSLRYFAYQGDHSIVDIRSVLLLYPEQVVICPQLIDHANVAMGGDGDV